MAVLQISRIGNSDVVRLINSGGFSDVFLAQHPEYGEVAIKLHKPGWEARARQETKIMMSLKDQEGVVRVYEDGADAYTKRYYTVMEYVSFPTLATVLRSYPAMKLSLAQEILRKIAKILDYVYQHSEVRAHRDIKPANVFVNIVNESVVHVKIADFGIVRVDGGSRTTAAFGDPDYNAPEQIENKPHLYGPGTDIYSMGCLAYTMLTGNPPFRGNTMEKLKAHCNARPPDISGRYGSGPAQFIRKCMAKQPRDRYADMGQFIAALDALDNVGMSRNRVDFPAGRGRVGVVETTESQGLRTGCLAPPFLIGCLGLGISAFLWLAAGVSGLAACITEESGFVWGAVALGGMGFILVLATSAGSLFFYLLTNNDSKGHRFTKK